VNWEGRGFKDESLLSFFFFLFCRGRDGEEKRNADFTTSSSVRSRERRIISSPVWEWHERGGEKKKV